MEKIKAVREALKLKQNEFAERLNITQSYLSALETGRKGVTNKVIETLIELFNVSPEWYYNNNGNIFNSSMGNIGGVNDGVNITELTKDSDLSTPGKEIIYNGNYDQNRIDFYYRHPDHRLSKLLSVAINDFKQSFNDYSKLVKISNDFGSPDFIKEKFEIGPKFNDYKKTVDSEFAENHNHITDKKLFKCFQLVAYESEIEHNRNAISQLINYMEMYVDFYTGNTKESLK